MFSRVEFEQLADVLSRLQGRFILTLNDVPAVRKLFAAFRLRRVKLSYTLAGGHRAKQVGELIITPRGRP
jgi:DNA adenine methylase